MRTHRSSGVLSRPFAPASLVLGLAATALTGALPAACSSESSSEQPPAAPADAPASAGAEALGKALRARFPAAFAQPSARPVEARVTLPAIASRPFRLRDRASQIEIAVALQGAADVAGAEHEDLAIFERAAPGGGDIVHRLLAEGVEDLVHFAARPAEERLSYALDLGGAAGLRLVANTLEVLDADGVPVLRAAPPYVLDAAGREHAAALSVEGCAFDTSPRAPFRRPVTPPGSRACTVLVDWSAARVRYPALVDPVWAPTFNTMSVARTQHTITLLNPSDKKSLSLVTGGASTVNGAPLKSAEIYDPLSRRFSATGAMNIARRAHTATLVSPLNLPAQGGSQHPVLVAGGADAGNSPIGSLEVYDPASGTFVTDGNTMAAPRFEHAAVLVADGQVLLAGGTTLPLNQPTNTAYVYTFQGFGSGSPPATVTSTIENAANLMSSARTGLAATRLTTGDVLVSGGFVLAGGALQALQSAELWSPAAKTFSEITTSGSGVNVMATQRGYHTSTALGGTGRVLVAGGLSKTVGGIYTNTVDIYEATGANKGFVPQAVPITMAAARANHSSTLLPDGRVLVAAGFSGSPAAAISGAEIFNPATSLFSDAGPLVPMQARGDFAALLVNAGDSISAGFSVLVTGGAGSPTTGAQATAAAQILIRDLGDPCTIDAECLSGFCTDGVCCDKRCDEICYACSVETKQSGNKPGYCEPAKVGADPDFECINQVESHTYCDGAGAIMQDPALTKSCLPNSCASDKVCATGCFTTADCDASGWCDLNIPGDNGEPGNCAKKKPNSASCYGDDQCESGFCVDEVCCASDCTGQCQACNLPGQAGSCVIQGAVNNPQNVAPDYADLVTMSMPQRTSCKGLPADGVRTACSGACVGVITCQYPDASVFLKGETCADDPAGGPSIVTSYPCDSDGGNTETTVTCAGYKCADETKCKTDCATDSDCIVDFVCTDGACVALTGPLCDGIKTLRKPVAQGGYEVCPDNFACPPKATACLTECQSINDCIQPDPDPGEGPEEAKLIVCTGEKKCVEEPPAAKLRGCAVSPPGDAGRGAAWLAASLAALLLARRRRASTKNTR